MNKIGLVFSGGGGKGAYQIGAWKALEEHNIKATVVAGTSVGALNAALYAQGDYEIAFNTWSNISSEKILSLESIIEKISKKLEKFDIDMDALLEIVKSRGIFSQAGLLSMMKEAINPQRVYDSEIPLYVCTQNKTKQEVKYFLVNDETKKYDSERLYNILLASAAIPVVFDNIIIDGEVYYDGGVPSTKKHSADNSPILQVYNQGCDLIIWIALSRDDIQERERFPNSRIIPIVPSADLGGIAATLDFSPEGAQKRMEQGYRDTKNILKYLDLFTKNEEEYEKLWNRISDSEKLHIENNKKIKAQSNNRIILLNQIREFNQAIRNDSFESFAEQEYYLDSISETDLLTAENNALLNDIERRDIQLRMEDYLDKNADNRQEIENTLCEAISFLAPVEGRSNELIEKKLFSRIWGDITGQNQRISAGNQKDLAKAQYAALNLMAQIQNKNLLAFEFAVEINNKVNRLFAEIANTQENINQNYIDTYRSLASMFFKIRKEILKDRSRIDCLEDRISQLEWLARIQVHTFEGIEYRNLPLVPRLICIINDFYRLTSGEWNIKELLSLKQAMINLQIENKEISLSDFFSGLLEQPELINRLGEGLSKPAERWHSLMEGVQLVAAEKKSTLPLTNQKIPSETDNLPLLLNPLELSDKTKSIEMPVFNFAIELLENMRKSGFHKTEIQKLEGVKKAYSEILDKLLENTEKQEQDSVLKKEIEEIEKEIMEFRIKVPLLGAFSSGKTTLINKHLRRRIFGTGIDPKTSLATEIYPQEDMEKLEVHYLNGEIREYPLSELALISERAEEILLVKVYLDNPILREHQDIILVDMPGFDSAIEAHNKALLNYIRRGVHIILCVEMGQVIKDSTKSFLKDNKIYDLELAVLLTKSDKRPPNETSFLVEKVENEVSGFFFKKINARAVSSLNNDLNGFMEILDIIEEKKEQLFVGEYKPRIKALINKNEYSLRLLLNEENLSLYDLEEKRKIIMKEMKELARIIDEEKKRIAKQCATVIPNLVANDIGVALNQLKSGIISEVEAGVNLEERMKGIAINTFQLSIKIHCTKLFDTLSQKTARYVSQNIYGIIDNNLNLNLNPEAFSLKDKDFGKEFMEMIILGLFYPLKKKLDRKKEIERTVESAIYTVETVRAETANIAKEMANKYFAALEVKCGVVEKEMQNNIDLLEQQLEKGKNEIEERKNKRAEKLKNLAAISQKLEKFELKSSTTKLIGGNDE